MFALRLAGRKKRLFADDIFMRADPSQYWPCTPPETKTALQQEDS